MSELMNTIRPYLKNHDEYGNEGVDHKGRKWIKVPLGKSIDITGKRSGKLVALFKVKADPPSKHTDWLCLCDCGNLHITQYGQIINQISKSCGCWHGKKEKIKKKNYIDLTGQRFNNALVIEKDNTYAIENNLNEGRAYWKCLLDDGRIITISGTELRRASSNKIFGGKILNHWKGSLEEIINNPILFNELKKKKAYNDMIGVRSGKLQVFALDFKKTFSQENTYSRIYWKCLCDCGNEISCSGTDIRTGKKVSCGCANWESLITDLTGHRFGILTVIAKTEKRINRNVVWLCKCDCGNTIEVKGNVLLTNRAKSCGCQKSYGEYKIRTLLNNNNIDYELEKTFISCHLPDSDRLLRFDFYIDNKFLLEYDGEQHFHYSNSGWNTKEQYELTHKRDLFKNQWCKDNNIILKRIPYTDLNKFTFEDIMSDKYILKESYYE